MATIIDSLIVTLGLDNKDFQQGVKQTEKDLNQTRKNTDKVGKQIANSGKDAAEFFGQMQKSALKFFAVLTAGRGIINFTRDVVTSGANLSRLSDNLNISADTLHRWGSAAKANGGNLESFLGTMQSLNNQVTEIFMRGDSAITPYLRQLGVGIVDATGKARPLTDVLLDIAKATEKAFPDKSQRYAYLSQMGFDEGTINLLTKGGKELQKVLASQQGFSQKDADAAYRAEQAWIKAQQRLEKMTRDLVIKTLPTIERMTESFVKFAEVIIPPLSKAMEIFISLDESTGGWSTNLLLALGFLRLIGGSAVIGGLTATAGILAGMAASVAPIAALLYSKGLNEGDEDWLKKVKGENYSPTEYRPNDAKNTGQTFNSIDDAVKRSLAERNNNPGNLRFVGQDGAVMGEKGFAAFKSTEAGIAAMHKQLIRYQERGINTVEKIISKWAPPNENNTKAYIDSIARTLGVDPRQPIDVRDQSTATKLIQGMSRHESGKNYLTEGQILSGLQTGSVSNSQSQNITIGRIDVHTQAQDARGVAGGLRGEIVRQFDAGIA